MTSPSVSVSFYRLVPTAVLLMVCMGWIGNRINESMHKSELVIADDWPTTPPDEEYRIKSFTGFSIVSPPGWRAKVSEDFIEIAPRRIDDTRSSLIVRKVSNRYRHPFPLPRTHLFQEGPAFVRILHIRTTVEEPEHHLAEVVLEKNGDLYEIYFKTYQHFSGTIPDLIWNYLETFDDAGETLTADLAPNIH